MNKSQQTASFGPLMRKFVAFAQVAGRASNHNIAYVIRSATSQRNNVLDMVFFPCNLIFAIVAVTFLPIILLTNFFSSVRALGVALTRTPIASSNLKYLLSMFRLIVATLACAYLFVMLLSIGTPKARRPISSLIPTSDLNALQSIGLLALIDVFAGLLSLRSPRFFFSASLTFAMQPIFISAIGVEVFSSFWQVLIASWAMLISLYWFGVAYVEARFASPTQEVFRFLVCKEKIMRCRKMIFAINTLLLRNARGVVHDLNHLCLVTLSSSVAKMVRCPILSSGLITPSLGNMPIITFFLATEKRKGEIL